MIKHLIPYEKFIDAKHVTIVVDNDSVACGSVLYSFVLSLHKKVTLVQKEAIAPMYQFLPWYKELREHIPASSDYVYEVSIKSMELCDFFKLHHIKINKKMATALYGALLVEYEYFSSSKVDGTVFALASELIEMGAEYKKVTHFLQNSHPLSLFRLKAKLLDSMILKENATLAQLFVSDEDLRSSGAELEDCFVIMKEVLRVVHVQEALLIKTDENNKIITTIKDI